MFLGSRPRGKEIISYNKASSPDRMTAASSFQLGLAGRVTATLASVDIGKYKMKKMNSQYFTTIFSIVIAFTLILPSSLKANENLCSFSSKDSRDSSGCAKDMDAEIREISRTPNTSTVYVKARKRGTYAGSIMFQVCCFSRIAKSRGYQYYVVLSEKDLQECKDCEWENEYVLGFLNSKTDLIKQEFKALKIEDQKYEIEDINESSMVCGFIPAPNTPFSKAVYYGNLAEVEKMFSENKSLLNEKNQTEFLPLHIAVVEGHSEIVQYLISSGADINCKGMYRWSPLHLAVKFNQADIANLLLNNKADPNFKMDWGNTPLHTAAYTDQIEIANSIITAGANINEIDNEGNTPLHAAASRRHLEMLKFLVSKSADPNKLNNQGQKPLHFAEMTKEQDVIDCLRKLK